MSAGYLETSGQCGVALMGFWSIMQRAVDMDVSVEFTRSSMLLAARAITDDATSERSATSPARESTDVP